jgi:hypothetical protein
MCGGGDSFYALLKLRVKDRRGWIGGKLIRRESGGGEFTGQKPHT